MSGRASFRPDWEEANEQFTLRCWSVWIFKHLSDFALLLMVKSLPKLWISQLCLCIDDKLCKLWPLVCAECAFVFWHDNKHQHCCQGRVVSLCLHWLEGEDFSRWQQCLFHTDQPDVSVPVNSVWTVKDLWRSLLCNENCLIRCSRNSVYTQWRVVWSYQTGLVNERHGLMSSSVKVRARVEVF